MLRGELIKIYRYLYVETNSKSREILTAVDRYNKIQVLVAEARQSQPRHKGEFVHSDGN